MGSAYQFHSWRVFVLVCAFPSVAAISALTTMPESPRFYLEVSLSQYVSALYSIFQCSFIYFLLIYLFPDLCFHLFHLLGSSG